MLSDVASIFAHATASRSSRCTSATTRFRAACVIVVTSHQAHARQTCAPSLVRSPCPTPCAGDSTIRVEGEWCACILCGCRGERFPRRAPTWSADCMGLALDVGQKVSITRRRGRPRSSSKARAGNVDLGGNNLVVRALRHGPGPRGRSQVGVRMRCRPCPHSRGLGFLRERNRRGLTWPVRSSAIRRAGAPGRSSNRLGLERTPGSCAVLWRGHRCLDERGHEGGWVRRLNPPACVSPVFSFPTNLRTATARAAPERVSWMRASTSPARLATIRSCPVMRSQR